MLKIQLVMHNHVFTMIECHEVAPDPYRIYERVVACSVERDKSFRMSNRRSALRTNVKLLVLLAVFSL
ncbi:MAG: hypothetical protein WBG50_16135 [Desulfomonilaceae bacterium]